MWGEGIHRHAGKRTFIYMLQYAGLQLCGSNDCSMWDLRLTQYISQNVLPPLFTETFH